MPWGYGLGDGHTDSARFTSADPEIVEAVRASGLVAVRQPGGRLTYGMAFLAEKVKVAERTCVVCGKAFHTQERPGAYVWPRVRGQGQVLDPARP